MFRFLLLVFSILVLNACSTGSQVYNKCLDVPLDKCADIKNLQDSPKLNCKVDADKCVDNIISLRLEEKLIADLLINPPKPTNEYKNALETFLGTDKSKRGAKAYLLANAFYKKTNQYLPLLANLDSSITRNEMILDFCNEIFASNDQVKIEKVLNQEISGKTILDLILDKFQPEDGELVKKLFEKGAIAKNLELLEKNIPDFTKYVEEVKLIKGILDGTYSQDEILNNPSISNIEGVLEKLLEKYDTDNNAKNAFHTIMDRLHEKDKDINLGAFYFLLKNKHNDEAAYIIGKLKNEDKDKYLYINSDICLYLFKQFIKNNDIAEIKKDLTDIFHLSPFYNEGNSYNFFDDGTNRGNLLYILIKINALKDDKIVELLKQMLPEFFHDNPDLLRAYLNEKYDGESVLDLIKDKNIKNEIEATILTRN